MNPDLKLTTHALRLTASNASSLLRGADVIIDGSDNLDSREASNGYAVEAGVPLVYAAVEQWRGQLAVFHPQRAPEAGCYQCLFPAIDQAPSPRTCAEAGVMGVVPAVLGSLQASEAIKCILDHDQALRGRLLRLDVLAMRFREAQLRRDPQCPVCGSHSDPGHGHPATMAP
jgi:adenylyltransferase/sulfurtransferase